MTNKINFSPHIAILGGGVAGCVTAIKLAEAGISVTLFDKQSFLLGSSDRTPGRMGLGFHYLGQRHTSERYLRSTINFVKKYTHFTLSDNYPDAHYLKKSWYLVCKEGFLSSNDALSAIEQLKDAYANLIKQDKSNAVFGEINDFYRILHKDEYQSWINTSLIDMGIEIQERLLDWPRFKKYLLTRINQLNLIEQCPDTEISHVKYDTATKKYRIYSNQFGSFVNEISYDFIINSTWENMEEINFRSNIPETHEQTKRLKLLAEVLLPAELHQANSLFFCLGPYCMFSNMGNGIGRITYAPITNHQLSRDIILPQQMKTLLDDPQALKTNESIELGNKIIQGVGLFIPAMRKAILIKIYAGIVKSKGEVDIYNSQSDFHQRNYSGVVIKENNWIDNAAIKLFYCEDNANQILEYISSQLTA